MSLASDGAAHEVARGVATNRRAWLACAAAVVIVAATLRGVAAVHAGSVWRDEANDIFLCRESPTVAAMLARVESEGSPPLRFLVECAVHWRSPDQVWPARALVIGFGSLGVMIVVAAGWRAFGAPAGVLAGLLMATSPFMIRFSTELRGYGQYQLAAALYALGVLWMDDRPSPGRGVVVGLLAALLISTHYAGAFLATAATVALVCVGAPRARRTAVIAATIVTVLCFIPQGLIARAQALGSLRPWAVPDTKGLDAIRVLALAVGAVPFAAVVGGTLVAVAVGGRREADGRRGDRAAILAAAAIGANLVAWLVQFVPALHFRLEPWYLTGMIIWTMPPIAYALVKVVTMIATAPRPFAPLSAAAAAAVVTLAAVGAQAADRHQWLMPRSTARQAADAVSRGSRTGDLVIVFPPAHASAFSFYYHGMLEQWAPPFERRITHVPWTALSGSFADPARLDAMSAAIDARLRTSGRVWLVAAPATGDQRTLYAQQLNLILTRLVDTLSTHGRATIILGRPAQQTWEPLEVTRFDGIAQQPWPGNR